MQGFVIFIVFLFGSIIGSFLNVCIYRIPRNVSIVFPPSSCTYCKTPIPFYFNIPIISYFILKGRCKFCDAPISLRYPFIEAFTGFFAVVCYLNWPPLIAFLHFIFISSLIVITFIDLDFQIIPDIISIPGTILSAIVSVFIFKSSILNTIIAILLGGGLFYLIGKGYEMIKKREGLGGGDVKLMAMFGAYLGIKAVLFITFFGSLLGSIIGVFLMIFQKKESTYAIPFGPFLCFGAIIYLFFGNKIISWYLTML